MTSTPFEVVKDGATVSSKTRLFPSMGLIAASKGSMTKVNRMAEVQRRGISLMGHIGGTCRAGLVSASLGLIEARIAFAPRGCKQPEDGEHQGRTTEGPNRRDSVESNLT